MSTSLPKCFRRLVFGILVAFVFLFGAGLYAVSGLPKPWARATREALDRADYQNFLPVARLVREECNRSPTSPLTKQRISDLLNKQDVPTGGDDLLPSDIALGTIVVRGQKEDINGMVWAVTDKGRILKVKLRQP